MKKILLLLPLLAAMFMIGNSCTNVSAADSGFVKADSTGFTVDGKPYTFVGTNFWFGAILASEGTGGDRERLAAELDFMKSHGIDNLRVLVGGDGPDTVQSRISPTLQKAPGVYNDTILRGLDYLLAELAKRDMKAVLYLNNSWEWSGGYSQYLEWAGEGVAPIPAVDGYNAFCDYVSRFATCDKAKEMFMKHIDNIVTRTNTITGRPYADDPAIMAWEIGNEPRAFGDESNKAAFAEWMAQASARIKSHDSNHLLTTGSEGMCGCEGDYKLFETIHSDPNIDYMTIHVWPKNWGWIGDCPNEERLQNAISNTMAYVDAHAAIARHHGKPMVMEEFGFPRDSMLFAPGSPTTLRDRYYDAVFGLIDNGTLAGCNVWAWGGFAKPSTEHVFWAYGDDYTGDPAQEEQGLNSVFACDSSTLDIIRRHSPLTRTPAFGLASRLKSVVNGGRYIFGHSDDTAYGHSWAYEDGRSDVKEVCGDYPGLINWDLGMIEHETTRNLDGVPFDLMRREIIAQDARGGISSISWHPRNPATGGDAWDTAGNGVSAGVVTGSAMNDTLRTWLGRVADFIGSLKDESGRSIPVVFRPWHEHTGSWFWWGINSCTADEYKALWRMTREVFDRRGIDNVLWAYSPSGVAATDEYLDRYPGDSYVDILGADVYHHGGEEGIDNYRASVRSTLDVVKALAADRGKIVALTETGSEGVPMAGWWSEVLGPLCAEYPVAYVCVWRNAHDKPGHFFGPYKGHKSEQSFMEFYNSPSTVFASDMR